MAYADGLLSQETFVSRIEDLLKLRLVEPASLTGDLGLRGRRRRRAWIAALGGSIGARWGHRRGERERLLALDWTGGQEELLIGRHHECDVVLVGPTVSRRHARMVFRDGSWIVQDLGSTNGTVVNGKAVGRYVLYPGDRLLLGDERLRVD